MKRNYHMLGKVYQINTVDSFEGEILHKELSVYPEADDNANIDIYVNYLQQLENKEPVLRNPSIHSYYKNGFRIELINASIEFLFIEKKLTQIDFCIKQGSKIRAMANKWLSYQFTNRKESIGYIFHELILIPSAFFFSDLSVVHASAIDDDGAILFGGTGGVGKTSLELELCYRQGKSFLADDIVVVNDHGVAFPNLSYPKIYGYNLKNNNTLKREVLSGNSIIDKIHWSIRNSFDPASVRRRVSAVDLYGNVATHPKKIKAFYLLVKDSRVEKIELSNINPEVAASLNRQVLETEYQIFYKFLIWDGFNSTIDSAEPRLTYHKLIQQIEKNFLIALNNVETKLVKIPINISHQDYLKQLAEHIII